MRTGKAVGILSGFVRHERQQFSPTGRFDDVCISVPGKKGSDLAAAFFLKY